MLFFQKQAPPAVTEEHIFRVFKQKKKPFYPNIRDVMFLFFLYRILHLIIIMFTLCLPFYLYCIYISTSTWYFHLFIYIYVYVNTHHAHKNTHSYACRL